MDMSSAVAVVAGAAKNSKQVKERLKASRSVKRKRLALAAGIITSGAASLLLRAAASALILVLLYAGAAALLSRFKDIRHYSAFWQAVQLEQRLESPVLAALRRSLPTNFDGSDVSGLMLFGPMFLLSMFCRGAAFKYQSKVKQLRRKRDDLAAAPVPLGGEKLDRAQLLEVYAEVKKSLDEHKQNLAFLSIDVVDSTGMKVGEDPGIAENDFRRYKRLVEDIIVAHKAMKSAWTPDGVMICFPSAGLAAAAAQAIIIGLDEFNRSVKVIKRDFAIRAGINSGEVFCDAATPMEEMTDRVIDIAGHMQKHGVVNGVAVSKHAIEPFLDKMPFKDAQRVVDGCPVYEWRKA